jgi:hypothetical protein
MFAFKKYLKSRLAPRYLAIKLKSFPYLERRHFEFFFFYGENFLMTENFVFPRIKRIKTAQLQRQQL